MSKNSPRSWYDNAPTTWIDTTREVDVSSHYQRFVPLLRPNAHVLEIGCGAGRDAKHFNDLFLRITAIDASPTMCDETRAHAGPEVKVECVPLLEFNSDGQRYDGVWALAALVHATDDELARSFPKIASLLQPGAPFYTTFKFAENSWTDANGRFYNWMTPSRLTSLLSDAGFERIEITQENDTMGRPESWLSCVCIAKHPVLSPSTDGATMR